MGQPAAVDLAGVVVDRAPDRGRGGQSADLQRRLGGNSRNLGPFQQIILCINALLRRDLAAGGTVGLPVAIASVPA